MSEKKIIELNAEELNNAAGGAGTSESAKLTELTNAWNKLGFSKHGYTSHILQAFFDQWKSAGYTPDATTFLKQFINW